MEAREALTVRLNEPGGPAWTQLDVFAGRALVELVIVSLYNAHGPVSAAAFGTTGPGGFAPAEHALLQRIALAPRNACELRTLRRTELTLLDTYISSATARRVLAGRVRRGQIETLEAALLLCDLRGFTELSNRFPCERVLALLDAYFDRVVPAIAAEGGEILKFMGDAVLAFFHRDEAAAACTAALRGALNALGDVNLASRIESVCSTGSHDLLMSERFARLLEGDRTTSIGDHRLKGFGEPVELHTLRQSHHPQTAANRRRAS